MCRLCRCADTPCTLYIRTLYIYWIHNPSEWPEFCRQFGVVLDVRPVKTTAFGAAVHSPGSSKHIPVTVLSVFMIWSPYIHVHTCGHMATTCKCIIIAWQSTGVNSLQHHISTLCQHSTWPASTCISVCWYCGLLQSGDSALALHMSSHCANRECFCQ